MPNKPKDVVVLVCAGNTVRLILTASSIEIHAAPLSESQDYFQAQGYVRGEDRDISFPTIIPPEVHLRGATRLEVWVKF